jgi:hypothetical protein
MYARGSFVLATVSMMFGVGCDIFGERRAAGEPVTVGPCIVDDDPQAGTVEQALVKILPGGVELFLDADNGGPLRCRPSAEACAAERPCVSAPVPLPVGVRSELAVGMRSIDGRGPILLSAVLGAGSDPAFAIDEQPGSIGGGSGSEFFLFLGVGPLNAGVIRADLELLFDASNAPADGSPITIAVLVEGVADDG